MFENENLVSTCLRNPLEIQNLVLKELEDRSKGTYVIPDANSAFCNLLEFGASISAACMQEIDNVVIPGTYARKAKTFKSISRHMSDFDYINLFATPAHTTIGLQLDTITLFDQARDYNAYYKKAVIPADAVFTIGNYEFGIYYPIEIQINKFNSNILVIQNVNEDHPLHKLVTNVLEHRTQTIQGVPMLAFTFPVYQFSRDFLIEDVIKATGFSKSYTYNYQFYACRIYTYFPTAGTNTGVWKELAQTTSDIMYDVSVPTAKIFIEPDYNRFAVNIPQVYIDNNQIGTKVKIELYTTQGAVDVDISHLPTNAFSTNFFKNTTTSTIDPFSLIFKRYPSLSIFPRASKIVGGKDSQSFSEIRTRVINNISHRNLLITPTDITKYFEDNQFKVTKHLDNISNRIYFCNGTLTDKDKSYIPITNAFTRVNESFIDATSDIKRNQSYSVTILPTAIYRFYPNSNTCEILSDEEKKVLMNQTTEDFVFTLNTDTYTKSPFHVVVNLPPARYQTATSYNLFATEVQSIQFKYDHDEITAQMVAYDASISHDKDGSDGYTIRLIVAKSADLKEVAEEDLQVYVLMKDSLGTWCGLPAEFLAVQDEYFIYQFHLTTDYLLEVDTINFTNIDLYHEISNHTCKLTNEFHVVYNIRNTLTPGIDNDWQIVEGLPTTVTNEYLGMGRQILTISLGHSLDSIIYNICDMTWARQTYEIWEMDVPETYLADVYETNEDGTLRVEIRNDGQGDYVWTNKLHSAGDVVKDEYGNIVYKYTKGEVRRDANGTPILKANRTYDCLVNMMHVDARMYMSQNPVHETFVSDLPAILESYFETIYSAKEKILEETELYYRPIRTMGPAVFSIGDGRTITQNLNMSFKLRLHVPGFVKADEEQKATISKSIGEVIKEAILKDKVSMTDIASLIKDKLSNYIDNIDVLGINGDTELQTIQILDDDAQASVAKVLIIEQDGSINLVRDIELEFISTDQLVISTD